MGDDGELLKKIEQLHARLEFAEKYPGISCSKPQDEGCFQNFLSARECPIEQICSTVNTEQQIYRCKTPSVSYGIKCGILSLIIMAVFVAIVMVIIYAIIPKENLPPGSKKREELLIEKDAKKLEYLPGTPAP